MALSELSILSQIGTGWNLNTSALQQTAEYRRGVHESVAMIGKAPDQTDWLCAAIPNQLDERHRERIRTFAIDLRSAVVDLIATSQSRLVLASPFWDSSTLRELLPLLIRRMDSGVEVTALGRFRLHEIRALGETLAKLVRHPRFRAVSWFHSESGEINTFHFKAVISDAGRKAYLGSANLTMAGLRSRMELGLIVHGRVAQNLAAVIDSVVALGNPVQVGETE